MSLVTTTMQNPIIIPVPTLSDGQARRALLDTLASLVTLARTAPVMLDLHQVEQLDSEGVSTLLACRRAVVAGGGTLDLAGITPRLRVLLELSRLHHVFPGVQTTPADSSRRRKPLARVADGSMAS